MSTRPRYRYVPDQWGIPRQRINDPGRAWPTYFLKRVPDQLKDNLNTDAETRDVSVADVIRMILCAHYRLDCPPRSTMFHGGIRPHTQNTILRLQPGLWRALKDDQKISGRDLRDLIITTLEKHYD